jgi:hypothetical protein
MDDSLDVRHRPPGRSSCHGCRFWQLLATNPIQGECRRHAPSPDGSASVHPMAAWPVTNSHDWCGEFAERAQLDQV